jgi:hypothetical protein
LWIAALFCTLAAIAVLNILGERIAANLLIIAVFTALAFSIGRGTLVAGPHVKRPWRLITRVVVISLAVIIWNFSLIYTELSARDPQAFSEALSVADSLYFTLATFTTTGFVDIHAASKAARLMFSLQMFVGGIFVARTVQLVVSPPPSHL